MVDLFAVLVATEFLTKKVYWQEALLSVTPFPYLLQSELTEVIFFKRGHLSKFCHIPSCSSI